MDLIFFNNQSGEDVIRAMQSARRREAKVVLSHTLVREIRSVLAMAEPTDDTVLLLRAEHRRRPRPDESRWGRWLRALAIMI